MSSFRCCRLSNRIQQLREFIKEQQTLYNELTERLQNNLLSLGNALPVDASERLREPEEKKVELVDVDIRYGSLNNDVINHKRAEREKRVRDADRQSAAISPAFFARSVDNSSIQSANPVQRPDRNDILSRELDNLKDCALRNLGQSKGDLSKFLEKPKADSLKFLQYIQSLKNRLTAQRCEPWRAKRG